MPGRRAHVADANQDVAVMSRSDRRANRGAGRDQANDTLANAVQLHRAGALVQAEAAYRAVLAVEPNRVDCLHNLGILAIQTNRNELAVELIGRAVTLNRRLPDAEYNLGCALQACGRLADAIEHFGRAVALKPDYAAAHMNLGNALLQQGRAADAVGCYARVLALEPHSAIAHYNIANVQARERRFAEAEASYRAAIERNAGFAEAFNNLGNVLKDQNRAEEAEAAYARALQLKPGYPDAHNNLGIVQSARGALDDALAHFQEAVRLAPSFVEARSNLGLARSRAGQPDAAIREFKAALALRPGDLDAVHHLARELLAVGAAPEAADLLTPRLANGNAETRSLFVLCLQALDADALERLRAEVLRAMSEGWARGGELEHVGITLIKRSAAMAACIARLSAAGQPAEAKLALGDLAGLSGDPLLREVMISGRASDAELERVLTAVRPLLLEQAADEVDGERLELFCAMARQCFVNEYAFAETDDERAAAERLAATLSDRLRSGEAVGPALVAAVAAYSPLHRVADAERLLARGWPRPVEELLTQQIREPAEEQEIKKTLPALTEIDVDSRDVQAQYEVNPYPRWITPPPALKPLSLNDYVRAKFPRAAFRPLATAPGGPDVLVAGCGSGSHAIEAHRRYAGARVLAIDLSSASLAYAVRKTRALGLDIEYGQADILRLGKLERRFDVIEAAGSLQCLKDPAVGWRMLLRLLRPGGVMFLGLYSKVARADINAARDYIAQRGHDGSARDIRRLRQEIMAFPDGTPARAVARSGDFYSTSDCRDFLFHVQEYQHTLPEIAQFIAEENLTFLGFQLDARLLLDYAAAHPDDPRLTNLAHWQAYENAHPDVFTAMYNFAVQKA